MSDYSFLFSLFLFVFVKVLQELKITEMMNIFAPKIPQVEITKKNFI